MSVELIDSEGNTFANVVRYDGRNELKIDISGNGIDLGISENFIRLARLKLEPFEDGALLSDARAAQFFC
ncbi:MAG: hypothetical protein JWS10_1494 [Cypionkella sp.]|nr:hypothetical protein [Cypionkella sp.]